MIKSVNHPWGISDKIRNRNGNTWADIDFVFQDKMSAEVFKEDPMNCTIGQLHVAGCVIKMKYKDLNLFYRQLICFQRLTIKGIIEPLLEFSQLIQT